MKPTADRMPMELISRGSAPCRHEPRVTVWNVLPGLLEVAWMAARLAGRAVVFGGGFVLLGTLLAWLLWGGPAGAEVPAKALWQGGAGLGLALASSLAFGWILGRTGGSHGR